MARSLTYQEFKERIETCRDGSYTLATPRPSDGSSLLSRTPIEVIHSCGELIQTHLQSFVNDGKGRCTRCHPYKVSKRTKKVSECEIRERFKKSSPHLEYVSGFTVMTNKCIFLHLECGREFETRPREINRYPTRLHCPTCTNESIRGKYVVSPTYLQDLIDAAPDGDEYEWIEEFTGDNKDLVQLRHITCGLEYPVRPNSFQQGNRCPFCTEGCMPSQSRNVKRIIQRLNELGAEFETEVADPRCKSDKNGQLRFDFALKHDDKLLIIEYDGEFHFEENIIDDFSRNAIHNTIRCDKWKNEFIKNHPDEYVGIERISYKDSVIKTLDMVLSKYYEI